MKASLQILFPMAALLLGGCDSNLGPSDIPPEQLTGLPKSATELCARWSGASFNGDGAWLVTYTCSEEDFLALKAGYLQDGAHWISGLSERSRTILMQMDSLNCPKHFYPQQTSDSLESLVSPSDTKPGSPYYVVVDTKKRRIWSLRIQS